MARDQTTLTNEVAVVLGNVTLKGVSDQLIDLLPLLLTGTIEKPQGDLAMLCRNAATLPMMLQVARRMEIADIEAAMLGVLQAGFDLGVMYAERVQLADDLGQH